MLGNDNARAQCTSVTYVLRASLPSKGDSVNRDFDNQASYLSIAQANLESGTTWAGVCCWGPQTRTIYRATLYTYRQKTIFHNSRSLHFAYKITFFKTNTELSIKPIFLKKKLLVPQMWTTHRQRSLPSQGLWSRKKCTLFNCLP